MKLGRSVHQEAKLPEIVTPAWNPFSPQASSVLQQLALLDLRRRTIPRFAEHHCREVSAILSGLLQSCTLVAPLRRRLKRSSLVRWPW
jgi:hypothetical protein